VSTAETTLRTILTGKDESAGRALRGVAGEAEKTKGHFSGLGKVAAGVFAGGALFEGAEKGVEFLKGAAEAASEDQANNAILARQLKNTTGATHEQIDAVEEWTTKTAEASGVAKSDLTPSLTKLATVTGSVGKAQKLTTLAMNVAAGTHQKLTSVTSAFVKAQNGSVGGLSRLGVATKNADGTTKSFLQIQKEMAKQFRGDSAAAADTAAGRAKRLGITWEEMKVQVGDHLLPVLTNLAAWILDKGIPAIEQLAGWLHDHLAPIITQVADLFTGKTGQMHTTVTKDLGAIEDTFRSVVSIVSILWKHFGGFITDYLIGTVHNIVQALSGAFRIIEGIFKVFSSLLKGDWKGVWVGIKEILSGALQVIMAVLRQALNLMKLMWKSGWVILKALLAAAWDGIKALARLEIQGLIELVKGIPAGLRAIGPLMLSAGKFLIQQLFRGIVAAAKAGAGFVSDLVGAIKNAINSSLHLPLVVNFDKGPVHIHSTVIPALAAGGILTKPGIFMGGEAGAEAVVPLTGAKGRAALGAMGGSPVSITINGALDPLAVGRQVQDALLKVKRMNNGLALGLA
jgi:phage-related protein